MKLTNAEALELMKNNTEIMNSMYYSTVWDHLVQKVKDFKIYQRSSIISTFLDQAYLSHGNDVPNEIQEKLEELDIQPQVLEGIYRQIEEFEAMKSSMSKATHRGMIIYQARFHMAIENKL